MMATPGKESEAVEFPDPGTPVKVHAKIGNRRKHTVLGTLGTVEGDSFTLRPAGAHSEVWFDMSEVLSVDEVPFTDLEAEYATPRFDHPLPETVREHLVQHHGLARELVNQQDIDSLLHFHTAEHDRYRDLSHVHGLTDRERDLVATINGER